MWLFGGKGANVIYISGLANQVNIELLCRHVYFYLLQSSTIIDRRACNVIIMCVCVTLISQTCCSRIVDSTTYIMGSFERSTHSLIGCKQSWNVI